MPLLTIEIDLSSLFDINIIVFTTLAFVFSVVVTIFLVLGLRPITTRARKANDLEPEKLSLTYLRLIMYVFAESIAFVADMFLVIFSGSYKVP
jgi:quinol-cytochrome oxidoreductase complex cytochrome b subunit